MPLQHERGALLCRRRLGGAELPLQFRVSGHQHPSLGLQPGSRECCSDNKRMQPTRPQPFNCHTPCQASSAKMDHPSQPPAGG